MERFLKVSSVVVLMLVLGSAHSGPLAAEEKKVEKPDEDVRQVTKFVLETAGKLKGNRIAILPFTYLDGSFSVEGRLVSDLLFMELAQSGKVELLEREQLATILQEHKMGKMGLLSPSSTPQLGKLTGVNGFIFGRSVDLGHKLQLTVRVVDTESKVQAQKKFEMQKRIKTPTTPLWEDIQKIKQKNKRTFNIEVWTERTEYTIGDEVVIRFKAERDCYVTIFDLGTSGQITVLFPNRFYATNFVKKDQVISIPGRFQNFSIKVSGPAGLEKLKIFATDSYVPLLPEQYNVSAFRSLDPKERSVTRDLAVTLTNLDDTAWAEATFEFQVKPKPKKKKDQKETAEKQDTPKTPAVKK